MSKRAGFSEAGTGARPNTHLLLPVHAPVVRADREELLTLRADAVRLRVRRVRVDLDEVVLLVLRELPPVAPESNWRSALGRKRVAGQRGTHVVTRRLGPDPALLSQDGRLRDLSRPDEVRVDVSCALTPGASPCARGRVRAMSG